MTLVDSAYARAAAHGFELSCEAPVGRLLAVLAAAVPVGGRILELGTGAGVGTAWLASGLLPRTDATVVSVELDEATAAVAATGEWPSFVELRVGDALALLQEQGGFDLVFADARGGKTEGLELTIAGLNPGGVLVVDDMRPVAAWPDDFRPVQEGVRRALLTDPRLVSVELEHGSGIIISTRKNELDSHQGGPPQGR